MFNLLSQQGPPKVRCERWLTGRGIWMPPARGTDCSTPPDVAVWPVLRGPFHCSSHRGHLQRTFLVPLLRWFASVQARRPQSWPLDLALCCPLEKKLSNFTHPAVPRKRVKTTTTTTKTPPLRCSLQQKSDSELCTVMPSGTEIRPCTVLPSATEIWPCTVLPPARRLKMSPYCHLEKVTACTLLPPGTNCHNAAVWRRGQKSRNFTLLPPRTTFHQLYC